MMHGNRGNMKKQGINEILEIKYPGFGNIKFPRFIPTYCSRGRMSNQAFTEEEPETKRWFIENIKDGWNIVDAGANIGMYSVLFGKLSPAGAVYCFEPTPTAEMLRENLIHNQIMNAEVSMCPLGHKEEKRHDKIWQVWGHHTVEQAFNFTTLDSFIFLKKQNTKIDLVKIDVDSYDYDVLKGSQRLLREQSPIIIVELVDSQLSLRGHTKKMALDYMQNSGYKLCKYLDGRNALFKKVGV
jgi:FkbM family methyltransferase